MISYLEPAQWVAAIFTGVALGIFITRAYDAIRHRLAMRRIRRNVLAYANTPEGRQEWLSDSLRALGPALTPIPPLPPTSGPEASPANRDPQATSTPGVAVSSAPPVRSTPTQEFVENLLGPYLVDPGVISDDFTVDGWSRP